MFSIASELKVFLDCGNYFGDDTNLGDEAVLRGIAEGFGKHLPQAQIKIVTFAGNVITGSVRILSLWSWNGETRVIWPLLKIRSRKRIWWVWFLRANSPAGRLAGELVPDVQYHRLPGVVMMLPRDVMPGVLVNAGCSFFQRVGLKR